MPLTAEQQLLVSTNLGIAYAVMQRLNIHGRGFAEAKSEAMVALCEAAETYTAHRGAFSTWAWAKVSWHLKTWMTKANRARSQLHDLPHWDDAACEDEPDLSPAPDEAMAALEVEALIASALDVGSELTRRVGVLALRGLTKEEIAQELGVSVSTVARRRKEARELLSPLKEIITEVEMMTWASH